MKDGSGKPCVQANVLLDKEAGESLLMTRILYINIAVIIRESLRYAMSTSLDD